MDHNRLTGVIPQELAKLMSLEALDLGANSLSGEIPGELGELRIPSGVMASQQHADGKVPGGVEVPREPGRDGPLRECVARMHSRRTQKC